MSRSNVDFVLLQVQHVNLKIVGQPSGHYYSRPCTLNPTASTPKSQPSNLNPQPFTYHLQPSTLSPQPSTLSPQPSTLNPQPSTLDPQYETPKQSGDSLGISAPIPICFGFRVSGFEFRSRVSGIWSRSSCFVFCVPGFRFVASILWLQV